MSKHYLSIFIADTTNKEDVVDKMDDPCFSLPYPSWGVCRPNIRYAVDIGSIIVFLGRHPNNKYFVKGLMRVGKLLNYAEASAQFPQRKNSLIRESKTILNPMEIIKTNHKSDTSVKVKNEIECIKNNTGNIPSILTTISYEMKTYVQSPEDDHEINNWKCRRIFNCQDKTLLKCLKEQSCKKEKQFHLKRGYIVADLWHDVGKLHIPWSEVCPVSKKDTLLRHGGRHNALKLSEEEVREIKGKLKKMSALTGPKPSPL
ncbi:hypothetical protein ACFQZR_19625 [Paenibacillus sp. GCM10027629]|uniref:hypothetical protein n=1 Tax=Paenibacillus sp. GCM10027629 TaxID=3273414 RepID=UPI00362C2A4E